MPVTATNTLLGGAGVLTALASVVAYRRKATGPFKAAYALTWPLLGSACILLLLLARVHDRLLAGCRRLRFAREARLVVRFREPAFGAVGTVCLRG